MKRLARIVKISPEHIKVSSLPSPYCIGCRDYCLKTGKIFFVKNSKNFDLKPGQIIEADYSESFKKINGIIAFLFPIGITVFSLMQSEKIAGFLNLPKTEFVKFFISIFFLGLSQGLIFLLSRLSYRFLKPEITKLL